MHFGGNLENNFRIISGEIKRTLGELRHLWHRFSNEIWNYFGIGKDFEKTEETERNSGKSGNFLKMEAISAVWIYSILKRRRK